MADKNEEKKPLFQIERDANGKIKDFTSDWMTFTNGKSAQVQGPIQHVEYGVRMGVTSPKEEK